MQKIYLLVIVITSLVSTGYSAIQEGIDNIIAKAPTDINIGVKIQSMDTGKVLYEKNADRYFMPASTQKTLTAAAALYYLGRDYTFKTTLYASNAPRDKTISGNLYIKFMADPTLTTEDMRDLINQLTKQGIKRITGHVYLDNSFLDEKSYGSGWMWDDQNDCFSAPVNAIVLNHNCFDVNLRAGKHTGGPTQIEEINNDSALIYTPVINHTITRDFTADDDACLLDVKVDSNNVYNLTGCVPPGSLQTLSFAINNVKPYSAQLIADLFKQADIQYEGSIGFASTPSSARELASHYSEPLINILVIMLKKSDNLIADTVFKTLGAVYFHQQGNWRNGERAIRAILSQKANVKLLDDQILDGAGLSRYNLITPNEMSQLLYAVYNNAHIGGDFIQGLPIAGVDGTLANKGGGRNSVLRSNIQAKTGTMTGVLALAGYIYTKQNHILSIDIMMNNFPGKVYPYFYLEMQIADYLIRNE